jgi:hypothetical protein
MLAMEVAKIEASAEDGSELSERRKITEEVVAD